MFHQMDVNVATKFGTDVSIFLTNIAFWTRFNVANEKHFYDGSYWTYNSYKAFSVLFPYWSEKQVRNVISNCVKNNLLYEGNYNKAKFDRTKWYALTPLGLELFAINTGKIVDQNINENTIPDRAGSICPNGQMDLPKRANGSAQTGRPIPDSKPDSKPDTTTTGDHFLNNNPDSELVVVFDSSLNPNPQTIEHQLTNIYLLKPFYTPEIIGVEDFISAAIWSINNRGDMAFNRRLAGIRKLVEIGKFEGEQEWINEHRRMKNRQKGDAQQKAIETQMRNNGSKELSVSTENPLAHKDMLKKIAENLKIKAKEETISYAEMYKHKKHEFRPYAIPEDFIRQDTKETSAELNESC